MFSQLRTPYKLKAQAEPRGKCGATVANSSRRTESSWSSFTE